MIGDTSYAGSGSMLKPTHYVNPHWVNSYVKRDGTLVRGYWRDGDGDTTIDRAIGYFAGNPTGHMAQILDHSFVGGDSALKDTLRFMLGYYAVVRGLLAAAEVKDRLGGGEKDRA